MHDLGALPNSRYFLREIIKINIHFLCHTFFKLRSTFLVRNIFYYNKLSNFRDALQVFILSSYVTFLFYETRHFLWQVIVPWEKWTFDQLNFLVHFRFFGQKVNKVNKQNCRIWGSENQNVIIELFVLERSTIFVWHSFW